VNDIPKEKTRVELLSLVDEESETEEIVEELIEADRTVVEEYHELAEIAKEEVITEQSRISSNGAVSREKSVTPITISNVSKVVSGKITTTEGGPLPGVNVVVKGTTHGTISDVDGNYEITVPEGQPSLAYSFIGYGTEEVQVGNRQVVDAELSQDMSQLSEVVVTAQGIERETKSLGYAISKKKDVRKQGAMPVIGFEAYTKYLQDSLRYPQEAIDKQVHGVVLVGFTVGKSGQLSKLEVKEGLGYGCDEEAIRLIKEGTGWQSAKNRRGDNVNELVKVEVTFEN
jgi:TonB family protein